MNGLGVAPVEAPSASAATTSNASNVPRVGPRTSSDRNLFASSAGITVTSTDAVSVSSLESSTVRSNVNVVSAETSGAVKLTVVALTSIRRTSGPPACAHDHPNGGPSPSSLSLPVSRTSDFSRNTAVSPPFST